MDTVDAMTGEPKRRPRSRQLAVLLVVAASMALLVPVARSATPAPGTIADIGTLGGTNSDAVAVDGPMAVGWSDVSGGQHQHAFAYDTSASTPTMTDLGTLPGGGDSAAADVSKGVVVGWSAVAGGAQHAFAYDSRAAVPVMVDLGTLGGTNSAATAIDGNIVVGWSDTGSGGHEAFAVDLSAVPRTMQDLGPGTANDVSLDLVSVADGVGGYLFRLGAGGGRVDIALANDTSEQTAQPLAISHGIAVGASWTGSPATPAAFVYDADAVDASIQTPVFPAPSTTTAVTTGYAVGWSGDGAARRAMALPLSPSSTGPVTLGAWTPSAVDGTAVVGDAAGGASYAINLGAPSPRSLRLPSLGGATTTHDISAGLVAGSADVSGARHAALWRVFETAVLTTQLDRASLTYGRSANLVARLAVAGATPLADRKLSIFARSTGTTTWHHVTTLVTGEDGSVHLKVSPRRNTDYETRFAGDLQWSGTRSQDVSVVVRPSVSAGLSASQVRPRTTVTLRGEVHPWRRVWLQSYDETGWHDRQRVAPSAKGKFAFTIRRSSRGYYYFRAATKPDAQLGSGHSGLRILRVSHPVAITKSLSKLPNVVLVLTDDQRPELLARMSRVQSLLVRHGADFKRMFVPNPACCPSRATILTGLFSHDSKVWTNGRHSGGWPTFHRSGDERRTIANALQRRGYRTALIGKYLNFYGTDAPAGYVPIGWDTFLAGRSANGGSYYNYSLSNGATYGSSPSDYSVDVEARQSSRFIRNTATGRPLFLYVAPFAPHPPSIPAPRDVGHWEGHLPTYHPPSVDDDMSGKPQWMQSLSPVPQDEIDATQAHQQDSLMSVDDQVATIIDALRDTGRLHHTLFLFTSDNGFLWGDHRLLGKDVPYTPADAVPLVMRWDGHITAGSVDTRLAVNADLAATIAAATGTTFSSDGHSLLGRFRRGGFVLEQPAGGLGRPPYCGFRRANWSFVQYATGERELYNVVKDPYELNNLHGDSAYAEIESDLAAQARTACSPTPPGFSW